MFIFMKCKKYEKLNNSKHKVSHQIEIELFLPTQQTLHNFDFMFCEIHRFVIYVSHA